jgi:hypothetical protein
VRESFRILAAIHALTRAEESDRTAELVEQLELGGFLTGLDGARHLSSEAGGLRQRLAFDAEQTTAAKVLAAVAVVGNGQP